MWKSGTKNCGHLIHWYVSIVFYTNLENLKTNQNYAHNLHIIWAVFEVSLKQFEGCFRKLIKIIMLEEKKKNEC